MAGKKVDVTFKIQSDANEMLEEAVEKYGLRDTSKALRCVLDYVKQDGDWDEIFKTVRCLRCPPRD